MVEIFYFRFFFLTVNHGWPRFTYQKGKKVFDPLKTNFGFVRQGRNLPWTRIVMFEWFRLKSSRSVLFFFPSTKISTFLLIINFCSTTNGTLTVFLFRLCVRVYFCLFRFSVMLACGSKAGCRTVNQSRDPSIVRTGSKSKFWTLWKWIQIKIR